jgi:hypothetical protein
VEGLAVSVGETGEGLVQSESLGRVHPGTLAPAGYQQQQHPQHFPAASVAHATPGSASMPASNASANFTFLDILTSRPLPI